MHEKYLKMTRDIFAKVAQRSVRMWKYILKLKGVAQWALQNLARMSRDSQHSTTHESDTSSFLLEMATTLSEDGLNNPQNLPVLVLHGSTVVYTSSCSGWISFWPSQMVGQLWISDFSAHLLFFMMFPSSKAADSSHRLTLEIAKLWRSHWEGAAHSHSAKSTEAWNSLRFLKLVPGHCRPLAYSHTHTHCRFSFAQVEPNPEVHIASCDMEGNTGASDESF